MATASTTVKVTPLLRDRINDAAKAEHLTPSGFLERLIEEFETKQWFREIKDSYARRPVTVDDQAEFDDWDVTLSDGLYGE